MLASVFASHLFFFFQTNLYYWDYPSSFPNRNKTSIHLLPLPVSYDLLTKSFHTKHWEHGPVPCYCLDLGFFSSHRILNWKTEACEIAWYPLHSLQAFSPWTDSVGKERRNFYQRGAPIYKERADWLVRTDRTASLPSFTTTDWRPDCYQRKEWL